MEFFKKHIGTILIIIGIILIIRYIMRSKESGYAAGNPCPGCGAGVKNCTCRGAGVNMVTAS